MLGAENHTPRKVIKWVANKDGGAHWDPDKPRGLQDVQAPPLKFSINRIDGSGVEDAPWPFDEGLRLLLQLSECVIEFSKCLGIGFPVDEDSALNP